MSQAHRVVIVGGGFAGLACARSLKRADAEVTVIDRRNFHLFQPLLYQVATGELSPANIASPIRSILQKQKNCQVLLGAVSGIDLETQFVQIDDRQIPFDSLVIATGSTHSYFGHDEWSEQAPGLKTIEDATEIRKRILYAFERANLATSEEERRAALTFVIVGAGPTGVELSGALADVGLNILSKEIRGGHPEELRIILCEGQPDPLGMYPPPLVKKAREELDRLGVELMTSSMVIDIQDDHVIVKHGDEESRINTQTVIWAAGVRASSLGKIVAEATGAEMNRVGKVLVNDNLSVGKHENLFVIGDLAFLKNEAGDPLPALAPVAMQQGSYVANLLKNCIEGKASASKPFHYNDRGSMAVIGRYAAIALVGKNKRQVSGIMAWFIWLFVHLMEITQFRNRLMVLFLWGWTYLTRDRSARLITGKLPRE
ncbi:NAD(P)/FAD-dependent oxidoreductase [uncultured Rubinisphaera sp.]|uniref:NAD(P)/FAD-dependent oxidoreductase n=1 Tax=uncultured Rubinisphaera sp. TaxID=1678686 RepID=UPI0030D869EC